jgi:hypothetical protein
MTESTSAEDSDHPPTNPPSSASLVLLASQGSKLTQVGRLIGEYG